ncbi:threonine-phosphate decarboxylase CobD [Pararhizobium sp. YC-54]|uniref:threonine-phosphate decarboxylase CobD n=1 Tax=Pararhizobium sp. YC-54 TaxID=2986920 RepID=UPI0021F6A8D9|nr:threonine-phosphate decarboxylase CobD [Pararhizobium sp. YC-54]MCV9996698.1 threonine-phosphate decarboxylase CobD [Pararhizobium sp. YC-54]
MSAPIAHGGGITEAAAIFGGRLEDWLDLSTGINPNPVALPEIPIHAWHRLPDRHLMDSARKAAARYYRSGDVLPLAVPGTQSVIQLLPRLVAPGRRIAIFAPTYGEYARAFTSAGFTIDEISTPDQLTPDHGLAILVNPNNPTGRAFLPAEVLGMTQRMKAGGGMLLVDEAFGDTEPDLSVAAHAVSHDNLIVFRSFGKFFGLAGLRLGFVVAAEPVLSAFQEWLGPWAVSGPALVTAAKLMGGDTQAVRSSILERREGLETVLRQAGLTIVGGTPLFALIDHERASDLHRNLCRERILTRKFNYAPSWLRIGLAPDAAGDTRLADALRKAHLA